MNEYKSISQLAKEIGVTRQAIYKKIKSDNQLSTGLQQFTVNQNKLTVYSLQGQKLIKQAFLNNDTVNQSVNRAVNVDSKPVSTNSKLVDSLTAQIETLTKQLTVKDEQLAAAQAQINSLVDTIHELTIALKAAQALHGLDKQQKTIEVKQEKAEAKAQTQLHTQKQKPAPKQKRTLSDCIKAFFK